MSKPLALFMTIATLTAGAFVILGLITSAERPRPVPPLDFDHVLGLCVAPEACGAGLLKRFDFDPQHATCECQTLGTLPRGMKVPTRTPSAPPPSPPDTPSQLAGPAPAPTAP